MRWFNNFVHSSAIQDQGLKIPEEGRPVELQVAHGPKGPQAEKVIKAGS